VLYRAAHSVHRLDTARACVNHDTVTSYAKTAKARMRDTILDAAYDLVVARGWSAARMADIAAAVGLSRQTLYNEFGSKDGLAEAVALRETERFLTGITGELDRHDDLQTAVEAAALFTFTQVSDNPLLKAVLTATDEDGLHADLLPLVTTRSAPLLLASRTVLAEHLSRHWPEFDAADVTAAAEIAWRLVISHLVVPTDPPDAVAARLGRLVTRFLLPLPAAETGQPIGG
jgi:AcrR family transcriptional regulator